MAWHRYRGARRAGARLAIVLLCTIAFAQPVHAAPPAGTIEGVARDAQQHSLAGVALKLEASDGSVVARATTGADGSFSFKGVAPGSYRLVGDKSGVGSGNASVTVPGDAGASADVTLLAQAQQPADEITVIAQRLTAAQIGIEPQVGASTYSFSSDAIANMTGGANVPLSEVLLHAPGVNYDSLSNNGLHIRNEHLNVQYRINGVILPEGISYFGQGLSPRFANSITLITGTLPAEYGLRTAGIADIQTKSGLFQPGGSVGFYGGSYDTVQPSFEYGGSAGGYNYFVAGDYLSSSHGIESPTPSYNAIHDDTLQTHAFIYLDKIVDSASKVTFIGGTFQGQFQIPNNPGQGVAFGPTGPTMGGTCVNVGCAPASPLDGTIKGATNFDSGFLNEHQVEGNTYGILSYLRSEEDFDAQVSGFTRYGRLSFHPDGIGDLIFNGIAQTAVRTSVASGIQADGSYKLRADHTLRGGIYLQGERASADTLSAVLPITDCVGPGPDSVAAGCPATGVNTFGPTPITVEDNHAKTGWLYSAYLQDEYRVLPSLTVNFGGRFDVVNEYTMENQISPRLNAVWKATDSTTVHAGYARYFTPPPFELVSAGSLTKFVATSASCVPNTCVNSPVKAERAHYLDAGVEQEILPGLKVGIDAYYKWSRNLLDEGQFGAPVILTPFNYHVGFNRGVELSTSYDNGPFSYYGNLAIAEQKAEGITSAQFNFNAVLPNNGCPQTDLQYAASHLVNTDHSQRMTATSGVAYTWLGIRYSVDVIAGSGLRTANPGNCFNEATVPSYEQVNLGVSHKFDVPFGGPLDVRFDIINALDEVYLIRSSGGVGVFASQYGPRRSFFASVKKEF